MDFWRFKIECDLRLHKLVLKKFDDSLRKFCEIEQIKLKLYPNVSELNFTCKNIDENNLAAATYSYSQDRNNKLIINSKIPYIKLINDYHILTFAHEVGHHLALKNFNDDSEEMADRFIPILAEEYLTNIERYIISIELNVWSKLKLPKVKINKKDWKKFKKTHGI